MASGERPPSHASQQRSGLSLYANLLNSSSASDGQTISRAPVVFKQQSAEDAQREDDLAKLNASLRFQPTKRPQQAAQKPKPKNAVSKAQSSSVGTTSSDKSPNSTNAPPPPPPPAKTTLADWTGDLDNGEELYAGEKRQRGGRKKRKKNKEEAAVVQDWDDIYDPSRPNNYEDYKHSEERYREIREWKDKLYAHRLKRRDSNEMSDDGPVPNRNFAPPAAYSFAPPPTFDDEEESTPITTEEAPPPPPEANLTNDATGDDAYARRMRLSGIPMPTTSQTAPPPPPPPPPPEEPTVQSPPPPPPPPTTQPPARTAPTISRVAVRYQFPAADASLPKTDAELEAALADADAQEAEEEEAAGSAIDQTDAPRSNRPGQKGFAERLMSKYGWSKGSGLGASGTGIVNPLRVQVEKRKKKSDAEGGGWAGPAAKGKILGSKQGRNANGEEAKSGDGEVGLSEIVILRGMVDGLDLDKEIGEGSLMQEIGEECGEKYGRVERVFVHREATSPSIPVFIKFTSQLSALRAVQALEGRIFNGNTIGAKFFDPEKFEAGQYE